MQNAGQYRKVSRSLGALVKEFFGWLAGFRSPQYIPQEAKYGEGGQKKTVRKSDLDSQSDDEGRWRDDGGSNL